MSEREESAPPVEVVPWDEYWLIAEPALESLRGRAEEEDTEGAMDLRIGSSGQENRTNRLRCPGMTKNVVVEKKGREEIASL